MNLCFDFDGPIIDVTDRYYRAYLESLKGFETKKIQFLSKEDFWKLKQNRVSDFEIGIMSGLNINEAKDTIDLRRDLSFKQEYFALDKVFNDVFQTFDYLKTNNIFFFVVTLRRNRQLLQAINQFKMTKYLTDDRFFSLPDEHKISNDIQEKYILLVNAVNKLQLDPQDTWLVGDSDTDIHAGKLARYGKVIAVSRGIRSKEQLAVLKPDYLINDFAELIGKIQKVPV
ncbi:MAG: HAD family hydrolase [Candidatus Melainabacteria bacterium]|nr:HAD family hydrolase [Candidatus Melainabacteria bacterium]